MQVQSIPFAERGQGAVTVVFLHGLFGNSQNWTPVMEDLADQFRMFAPEFPINGVAAAQSAKHFHSIAQLTEFVKAFFDDQQIGRAVLCGNSLGGQVGIDFCLRYPHLVDRLVLSGSAGLFERSLFGGHFPRATRTFVEERIREVFYDERHVTEELIETTQKLLADRKNQRLFIRIAKASRSYNVKGQLHNLRLPTLIVWGENDEVTPPSVGIEFSESIPGSELVMLPECGHSPPVEKPEEFGRALRDFLGSNGNGNGRPRAPR